VGAVATEALLLAELSRISRSVFANSLLGLIGFLGVAEAESTGPARLRLTVIAPASTIGTVAMTPERHRAERNPDDASAAACRPVWGAVEGTSPEKTARANDSRSELSVIAASAFPRPGTRRSARRRAMRSSRPTLSQKAYRVNQSDRCGVSLLVRNMSGRGAGRARRGRLDG